MFNPLMGDVKSRLAQVGSALWRGICLFEHRRL